MGRYYHRLGNCPSLRYEAHASLVHSLMMFDKGVHMRLLARVMIVESPYMMAV